MPCELSISNFDELAANFTGITNFTASGRAVTTVAPSKSVEFEIKLTKIFSAVFVALRDAAQENIEAQGSANDLQDVAFPVEVTGFTPDESITFDAVWNPSKPVSRERFSDSRSYGILLRLVKL